MQRTFVAQHSTGKGRRTVGRRAPEGLRTVVLMAEALRGRRLGKEQAEMGHEINARGEMASTPFPCNASAKVHAFHGGHE